MTKVTSHVRFGAQGGISLSRRAGQNGWTEAG
jgi:hypothetical protein